MAKHALPSIQNLFKESYTLLRAALKPLLILNILWVLAEMVILGIGAFIVLTGGLAKILQPSFAGNISNTDIVLFAAIIIVACLLSISISMAMSIASILILNSKGKMEVMSAIRKGLPFVLPVTLAAVISGLVIMGSLFLFVLPAILMMLVLMFVSYEIILNRQNVRGAIARSVTLVLSNFSALFFRWLVISVVYIGIVYILPSVLDRLLPDVGVLINIVSFLMNLLLGWFIGAYNLILYKESIAHTPATLKGTKWVWLVAICGWIIGGLVLFGAFNYLLTYTTNYF